MELIAFHTDLKNFEEFHPDSKLWIYSCNRLFSEFETEEIAKKLTLFCSDWRSHGTPISASFSIVKNCMILLSVDAKGESASGCSIDSSMAVIKELENELKISLTNRLSIILEKDNQISFVLFHELLDQIKKKSMKEETKIYNNSIDQLKNLSQWKQPIYNSWISKL
mgnify:CR=1 FL=1